MKSVTHKTGETKDTEPLTRRSHILYHITAPSEEGFSNKDSEAQVAEWPEGQGLPWTFTALPDPRLGALHMPHSSSPDLGDGSCLGYRG